MAAPVTMKALLQGARLADGDRIKAERAPGEAPDEYSFTLSLGNGVTWWKALIAVNENGVQTQIAQLQDSDPSATLLVTQEDLDNGTTLELWKAKTFGIHTHIYTITDLSRAKGRDISLSWNQD